MAKSKTPLTHHRGALSELRACEWLLLQGFEVFRNVSGAGPADLVAWKPGEPPVFIDVKTASTAHQLTASGRVRRYITTSKPTPAQAAVGVVILHVCPRTGTVSFDHAEIVAANGGSLTFNPRT